VPHRRVRTGADEAEASGTLLLQTAGLAERDAHYGPLQGMSMGAGA
jgi:hypothetical protein